MLHQDVLIDEYDVTALPHSHNIGGKRSVNHARAAGRVQRRDTQNLSPRY